VYRARDDRWLAVAAIEPAFFANLCRALNLERWIPHQLDDSAQDEIRSAFRDAFATRDRDPWVAELGPANTCVSPVNSIAELVRNPQFEARGAFTEAVHPDEGRFRQVGPVLAGGEPGDGPARLRGSGQSDATELLRAAGLAPEAIEKLRRDGVVA
jgi:crotonobetainyl-CoA:carnitine CoA-transferase CaiB-like acyl-CoA transferase